MAKSYPHKQTLLIAIVCTLAVIGTVLYIRPQLSVKQNVQSNIEVAVKDEAEQKSAISDVSNPDWKKAFLTASTSTKPDVAKTGSGATSKAAPLTLTEQLSRDFFTNYAELKKNNQTSDTQSVQTAMNQTLSSAIASAPSPKTYNLSNVIISETSDSNSMKAYGNIIGTIFEQNGPKADPAVIATDALENNDMTLLLKIKPITASYEKMVKAVLAVSVPRPLANFHLRLVNGLSLMVFVSQGLEKISDDPMQSMVSLNIYTTAQDSIRSSLLSMNNYFDTNRIYFTNSEPGILFVTVPQ
jgi:hypothetical protein